METKIQLLEMEEILSSCRVRKAIQLHVVTDIL